MPSRPRLLTTAAVAASLLAPVEGVDAATRKNGIIFEIETSQRIAGESFRVLARASAIRSLTLAADEEHPRGQASPRPALT
jgi:hypothetical protein